MANTTGVAPVCNAPPEQPTFISKAPPFPQFVPPNPNDPVSIIAAIQALQIMMLNITNQIPPNNTIDGTSTGGGQNPTGGGGGSPKKPKKQQQDWEETDRTTQDVKVVNPEDDSQFVIVKEITSITFKRRNTDETFTLTRDHP